MLPRPRARAAAYSLTLVPKEELEIEIVRRAKFSRALHEQRSVESEFRFEFQGTSRDEWSAEQESNFAVHADEGFSLFGLGVHATQDYAHREAAAEDHLREIVSKTASRVSQRYDVAVDVKTEVENQYRSVRKVSNPNPCHPVIYLYYQLAQEVPLRAHPDRRSRRRPPAGAADPRPAATSDRIRRDTAVPPDARPAGRGTTAGVTDQRRRRARAVVRRRTAHPTERDVDRRRAATRHPRPAGGGRYPAPDAGRSGCRIHEQDVDPKVFAPALDKFLGHAVNKVGTRATYEYCIATDGLYVEGNVSPCAVCDGAPCKQDGVEA